VELGERSLVALNKIRAFVRTLGKIDSAKKESSEGVIITIKVTRIM